LSMPWDWTWRLTVTVPLVAILIDCDRKTPTAPPPLMTNTSFCTSNLPVARVKVHAVLPVSFLAPLGNPAKVSSHGTVPVLCSCRGRGRGGCCCVVPCRRTCCRGGGRGGSSAAIITTAVSEAIQTTKAKTWSMRMVLVKISKWFKAELMKQQKMPVKIKRKNIHFWATASMYRYPGRWVVGASYASSIAYSFR
jgi:hypothetical protein